VMDALARKVRQDNFESRRIMLVTCESLLIGEIQESFRLREEQRIQTEMGIWGGSFREKILHCPNLQGLSYVGDKSL